MRSARLGFLPLLAACLALGGCASSQGRVYTASLAPGSEEGADLAPGPVVRRAVVGRDARITSVLFFPTFDGPRLEVAVGKALDAGGGQTLHGLHVRTVEFWLLVGWSVLEVRGDVAGPAAPQASR